jgi:peptidoglycan/xylan/chitin deacetylase (PgdA/CDA1 family)
MILMNTPRQAMNILMYHSISDGAGPTCIPTSIFGEHLLALAEAGYQAVSLTEFAQWHRGQTTLPDRTVVFTFDDGFLDFATEAFPLLQKHHWSATVFLPSGKIGGREAWPGGGNRQLLDWAAVRELAGQNVQFGGHTIHHVDLTQVSLAEARREIAGSKDQIEQQLGHTVTTFAPPYGKSNPAIRNVICEHYELSVGTDCAAADPSCDVFNLPRIEMHYFRNPRRWREYLAGHTSYFTCRRSLRRVRQLLRTGH